MIRRWMMMLVVAALAVSAATAQEAVTPPAAAEPAGPGPDEVVLRIGQTEITQAELDERMAGMPGLQRAGSRDRIVQQLVTRALYLEFVRVKNLTVDEADYEQKVTVEREAFEKAMAREQAAFDAYLENLRPMMALNAYVKQTVSDEQVAKLMADHPEFFDGTKLKVSHILVKCSTWDATADQKAALKKLQDIVDRINKRELTFAEAASQFSECPSSSKGGDLGDIEFGGPMDPYFTMQAFGTPEGHMSKIFRTSFGWHVVLVTHVERGDGTPKPWKSRMGSEVKPESLAQRALRARFENEMQMAVLDAIPVENKLPPLPEPPQRPAAVRPAPPAPPAPPAAE